MSAIRSRPPTGEVPWPVILLEGPEKAGKTWSALLLSASERVGRTFVLDLGEGSADEYGAIPGVRFEVLEHDGSYAQILDQVSAVRDEAKRAKEAGEPPVVLVIDTMTALWEGLKDWISHRAASKPSNKAKLAADPAAELDVSRNLWNDAGSRHARVLNLLLTFPGIVVMTARGKEVSATDPATGQPFRDGRKEYRVEGHKNLAFSATAWVRMSRTEPPIVIGARSVHTGIVPGRDEPQPIKADPANLLEWLIFDALKVNPDSAHVRDLHTVTGGEPTADELADERKADQEWKARKIPATDSQWHQAWCAKLATTSRQNQLPGLWADMVAKHKAKDLTDDDRAGMEKAFEQRRDVLAQMEAMDEANGEPRGHLEGREAAAGVS